jgi:cell filamentation protein
MLDQPLLGVRFDAASPLGALGAEIASPGQGHLDRYLLNFVGTSRDRHLWGGVIDGIQGLDGGSVDDAVDGEYSDARVRQRYQTFESNRSRSKAGSS